VRIPVSLRVARRGIGLVSRTGMPEKELLGSFDAARTEAGWSEWWETSKIYETAHKTRQAPNTVLLPPPNVTGQLHLGHALTVAVEDSLVRYWRMRDGPGSTTFIPGTDHAGIGTQVVVERHLWATTAAAGGRQGGGGGGGGGRGDGAAGVGAGVGRTRHEVGRTDFVKMMMEWSTRHQHHILGQLRRLGASLDWSRLYFTMDQRRSEAVTAAFIRLFEDQMIYRDTRFVNWSCHLKTAISDLEVETIEVKGPTLLDRPAGKAGGKVLVGVVHNFAYPLADPLSPEAAAAATAESGPINEVVVTTTRLETMLGDVAVAVHPEDRRYKHLHGKFLLHPLNGTKIPVVADATLVDPTFGTGAVKVTPAHDKADYDCAIRHNLRVVPLLNDDGTLNQHAGKDFAGRDRFDVREELVSRLEELGLYRGRQDHEMSLAICSRSKDILEPLMKPQWYVRCKDMAHHAAAQVRSGRLQIIPAAYEQDWLSYLDHPQDWCISRQLWWGHQIPAYLAQAKTMDGRVVDHWVVARSENEAKDRAREHLSRKGESLAGPITITRDPDVLDTWFSSALLPLSTADNREKEILKVMETGGDILFFWVARMAMLCSYLSPTRSLPFSTILLHGIVRDAQGRKMSKSLGNVIDPIHVIEGATRQKMEEEVIVRGLAPAEQQRSLENIRKHFSNVRAD